jgi:glucose/arabinose dehydrogenase
MKMLQDFGVGVRTQAKPVIKLVAQGFAFPTSLTFDRAGNAYVAESGLAFGGAPPGGRIWRLEPDGTRTLLLDGLRPPVNGLTWHEGSLFISEGGHPGRISRLDPGGERTTILDYLLGPGNYHTNMLAVGPDGKLYFSQGAMTNTGIIGLDAYELGWLKRLPHAHDIPGYDIALAGANVETPNPLAADPDERASTGAFVPFGTPTYAGQRIPAQLPCTAAVMRCNPDGSDLELFAWGVRNAYGLGFLPDGRLLATDQGADDRGSRPVGSVPDLLFEVRQGAWYGWPDFASGVRLDDPHWGDQGRGREPVIAGHPNPNPPKPFATFDPHAGVNGFDFCREARFGFEGDAFVTLFGDIAPITARPSTPRGFKVVRVEMKTGRVYDFAVNKIAGAASQLPHEGFERPSHCQFGPDGALYVVDYGEVHIAPEVGGIRMKKQTGTLWRIRRTDGPGGDRPPEPMVIPLHFLQNTAALAGVLGAVVAGGMLLKRALRGQDEADEE